MTPEEKVQLLSQQEAEQRQIQEKIDVLAEQYTGIGASIAEAIAKYQELGAALAEKTSAQTAQSERFEVVDKAYHQAQSTSRKAKKAKQTVDETYKAYRDYEAKLKAAEEVLTSGNGYEGSDWYFPRGFSIEDVLTCFDSRDFPRAEQQQYRTYNRDSQSFHTGSYLRQGQINFKYAGQDSDESPRALLLDKIAPRLETITRYLDENATTTDKYQQLDKKVRETQEAEAREKEAYDAAVSEKEALDEALGEARDAWNAQGEVVKGLKASLAQCIAEKKLYEEYYQPLNESLFTALNRAPVITGFVKKFDVDESEAGDETPSLKELADAFNENAAFLAEAREIQQAYDAIEFSTKDTGFREKLYADDALNCIEEQQNFQSFRDEVLEQHYSYCKSIPDAITKLAARQTVISKEIQAKQKEVSEAKEAADLARAEAADKYLPQSMRSRNQNISGINDLGRLDSYINQRNTTYATWDMFSGFVKALASAFDFISCCFSFGYKTQKEIRSQYVEDLKSEIVNWRDSGNSTQLSTLLARKGTFKSRRDDSMEFSTLAQNTKALSDDVAKANALMPSDDDIALATQMFSAN